MESNRGVKKMIAEIDGKKLTTNDKESNVNTETEFVAKIHGEAVGVYPTSKIARARLHALWVKAQMGHHPKFSLLDCRIDERIASIEA